MRSRQRKIVKGVWKKNMKQKKMVLPEISFLPLKTKVCYNLAFLPRRTEVKNTFFSKERHKVEKFR